MNEKPTLLDMQVGVAKTSTHLVSLSLSGTLNWWPIESLTEEVITGAVEVTEGHRKGIISAWYSEGKLISVDLEGNILKFTSIQEKPQIFRLGHSLKNASFSPCGSELIVSSSKDAITLNTEDMSEVSRVSSDGYINKICWVGPSKFALITNKQTFSLWNEGAMEFSFKLPEEGISVDINSDCTIAFVGSSVRIQFLIIF